ncbi:hypothetical protein [Lutibacter sp.]
MEKKNENLDLISLNSKIFDEISIEELEERLELTKPWICDCSEHGCSCYQDHWPQ